jgi:regulator of protease activity HflC (stomatin/prohibitin superfamily)
LDPARTVVACDLRRKPFQINSQEVVTENRAVVRLSLSGECQVSDPAAFVRESSDSYSSFLLDIKQALRSAAAETHSKALLSGESLLLMRMRELLVPRAAVSGVELRQLEVIEVVPSGWLEDDTEDDED